MEQFDVIVIGGGVSGLGVARETTAAGISTLLVEAASCGNATSNNTLRIIHGGFRYLQTLDFPRVIKSLNDQTALITEVPDAVQPLPCLMPLARFGMKSRIPVACANLLYGAIMRMNRSPLPSPHILSSSKVNSNVKILRNRAPHGALCWYDGVMIDPSRVTSHLVHQITSKGGTIKPTTPISRVEKRDTGFTVHASTGESWNARTVVTTLGPNLASIELPPGLTGQRPLWCKGFNLVVKQQLDPTYGIGIESADGRLFFCVPRGGGTAIGTWYLPHPDISAPLAVSEHEIAQFLRAFNAALPGAEITKNDITHIDVGVLPMERTSPSGPVLIAHERIHARQGLIEVMSTKYTTFRSQGRAVLDLVKQSL